MAMALQPYVGFIIAFNERIFLKSKIFPIDPMLKDNGQKSAMLLEV